ncbi:hypothetical protein [Oleiharenicola lentus]|uniref:hypothetical protein n=1 Tax=Oleiharenicola lentus TaxID=2508720 RepID=UPI003F66DE9D
MTIFVAKNVLNMPTLDEAIQCLITYEKDEYQGQVLRSREKKERDALHFFVMELAKRKLQLNSVRRA